MNKQDNSHQNSVLFHKVNSNSKVKFKQLISKSKQFQTICLNQSELKHMHAIRPFSSKERKSSRRDSKYNQSPHQLSRSKSKRFDSSSKKTDELPLILGGKQLSEMYSELISLKSEYKLLKNNYNKLYFDKKEAQKTLEIQRKKSTEQLETKKIELQQQKKNNSLLQKQLERIKKQCYKFIQMEKFKGKKLEQTIQEKQLMIAFLRNQLQKNKRDETGQHSNQLFFIGSRPPLNFDYFTKPINISGISQIPSNNEIQKYHKIVNEEDSLSFSRDKSKEHESLIHSFLSHDQSLTNHKFIKKEQVHINSLDQSPITQQIEIIDQASEKSQKSYNQPFQSDDESKVSSYAQITQRNVEKVQEFDDNYKIREVSSKNKFKQKQLQISINDENTDHGNIQENIPLEIKKKTGSHNPLSRPRKKMTVKKSKAL